MAARPRLPGPARAPAQPEQPTHRFATIHTGGPETPGHAVRITPHPSRPGVWQVHPNDREKAQQATGRPTVSTPKQQPVRAMTPQELCPKVAGCEEDAELGVHVPKNPERVRGMLMKARAAVASKLKGIGDQGEPPAFRNTAQSTKEILEDAQKAEPLLRQLVQASAQAGTGDANVGPGGKFALKSPESLGRKVTDRVKARGLDEKDIVSEISDAVRGSVLVDTPEQLKAAADAIRKRTEAAGGKIYIDNKWEQDVPGGYAGVHADLLLPVGNTGRFIRSEVQLHLKSVNDGTMEAVKEKSHALYERTRAHGVSEHARSRALGASMLMFLSAMQPFMGA